LLQSLTGGVVANYHFDIITKMTFEEG
jgi:hypothetical protein